MSQQFSKIVFVVTVRSWSHTLSVEVVYYQVIRSKLEHCGGPDKTFSVISKQLIGNLKFSFIYLQHTQES